VRIVADLRRPVTAGNSVEVDPAAHDGHSAQHYRLSVPV